MAPSATSHHMSRDVLHILLSSHIGSGGCTSLLHPGEGRSFDRACAFGRSRSRTLPASHMAGLMLDDHEYVQRKHRRRTVHTRQQYPQHHLPKISRINTLGKCDRTLFFHHKYTFIYDFILDNNNLIDALLEYKSPDLDRLTLTQIVPDSGVRHFHQSMIIIYRIHFYLEVSYHRGVSWKQMDGGKGESRGQTCI